MTEWNRYEWIGHPLNRGRGEIDKGWFYAIIIGYPILWWWGVEWWVEPGEVDAAARTSLQVERRWISATALFVGIGLLLIFLLDMHQRIKQIHSYLTRNLTRADGSPPPDPDRVWTGLEFKEVRDITDD